MPTPRISFEFFPPQTLDASFRLWETVQQLAPLNPDYVSVTYGAGGTTRALTHDAVKTIRRTHGLRDKFIVLYAGAHGMSHDLGVVLDCANLLVQEKNIHFVFLGDGKEKPALQLRTIELDLPNVSFLPPVPKSGMPAGTDVRRGRFR